MFSTYCLFARARVLLLLVVSSFSVGAQTVPLGAVEDFGVLGASAVTNTGPSLVTGDLGISPNAASSVTGFTFSTPPGPGQVTGTTHFADALAIAAQVDATTAYNTLAGRPCDVTIPADLGGLTLPAGVYCSASTMGLTGTVTLDAQGDPDAVFIFQVGSALTTASGSTVQVINGGQSCNVFWQIGSSATLGTGTDFLGTIIALTSITMTTGATADGRVIARNGAVTLDNAAVSVCALAPAVAPTISKAFNPTTIAPNGLSTLTITLTNTDASAATLLNPLVDSLPPGVVVAAMPNASTTCSGGAPIALAGALNVTLPTGATIPAGGSCSIRVDVTAAIAATYVNTIPAGALVTSNGSNPDPAVATLIVIDGVPPQLPATAVPTLSLTALVGLAGLFGLLGVGLIRRGTG